MEKTNDLFAILPSTSEPMSPDAKIQALVDLHEIWSQRLMGMHHALRIIVASLPADQRSKVTVALRKEARSFDDLCGFTATADTMRDILRAP